MQKTNFTRLTASGVVLANSGALAGIVLTAGSDVATVTLDDSTDGTGTVIIKLSAAANTSVVFTPDVMLDVANGIYATITGTAPNVTVLYVP